MMALRCLLAKQIIGCALPQDGHTVCGDGELARARGDHAVEMDLDLHTVNSIVVVVGNNCRIAHVDGVQYERLCLGSGRGHHSVGSGSGSGSGSSRLCQGSRAFCCCGLCLGGHVFVAVIGSTNVIDGVVVLVVVLVVLFAIGDFLLQAERTTGLGGGKSLEDAGIDK